MFEQSFNYRYTINMNITTPICPTYSCSLVRLGITKEAATTYVHEGNLYYFCCEECLAPFKAEPKKYIDEIADMTVCPTCLAEKSLQTTVTLEHAGTTFHFCRCPHCLTEFKKNPDHYIKRLEGETAYAGIFGDPACC